MKGYNSLKNKIAIPAWMKLMKCETKDELREKLSKIDLENLLQILKDLDPYTSQNIACSATIDGDFFTGKAPCQGYPNRKDGEKLKSIFRKSTLIFVADSVLFPRRIRDDLFIWCRVLTIFLALLISWAPTVGDHSPNTQIVGKLNGWASTPITRTPIGHLLTQFGDQMKFATVLRHFKP